MLLFVCIINWVKTFIQIFSHKIACYLANMFCPLSKESVASHTHEPFLLIYLFNCELVSQLVFHTGSSSHQAVTFTFDLELFAAQQGHFVFSDFDRKEAVQPQLADFWIVATK